MRKRGNTPNMTMDGRCVLHGQRNSQPLKHVGGRKKRVGSRGNPAGPEILCVGARLELRNNLRARVREQET